jgi:8-oxo-dGTP diphosphatase
LRLLQVREKTLPPAQLENVSRRAVALAHAHGARVVVNAGLDLARTTGADGVHLTAAALMALDARPPVDLVGASCHSGVELAHAARLGLDFVQLSPVLPTLSHPGAATLGWDGFAGLIRDYPLPVYALGGMGAAQLDMARGMGAHGIAVLRTAWSGALDFRACPLPG